MPRRPKGEVEVQLYSFFNLGDRWRWVVNATLRSLYPGAETRYPFYRRLDGAHGRSGRVWNIWFQPGLDLRTFQVVASPRK